MRNVYLSYLALVKKMNGSGCHLSVIDESAKRLLEVIALSHAQNRPLSVFAAIALTPIASPHTPHRKLGLLHKLRQIYGQMFFDRKN
jgi:hypothetical protein